MSSTKKSDRTRNPSIFPWLRNLFGGLNRDEKYYLYAFLVSILLGLLYGLFDHSLAQAALRQSPSLVAEQSPTHAFQIFSHNFLLAVVGTFTFGIGNLVMNFFTFAAVSGLPSVIVGHRSAMSHIIPSTITLLTEIILFVIGTIALVVLEEGGFLCLALVGFTVLERGLWKRKTKLRRVRLLLVGTSMLAVAAIFEWSLEVALYLISR